ALRRRHCQDAKTKKPEPFSPVSSSALNSPPRGVAASAAQPQPFDQLLVTVAILALEVVQQLAALIDQLQQATTGVMVGLVLVEVLGQLADAGGQQRHLDFRRTGVAFAGPVLGNDFAFLFYGQRHSNDPVDLPGARLRKAPRMSAVL